MAFHKVPTNTGPKKLPQPQGIIKQSVTRIPLRFYINAAASLVAVAIVALAVRGVLYKEDALPCSTRYDNGTLFGLQDKSGGAISPTDLQGRLAGSDWGLLENTTVVRLKDGPAPVALQISLPKLADKAETSAQPKSGMGFTWLPTKLPNAKAACLTYNVWLPQDFNFGTGGALPGLFGGEAGDTPSLKSKAAFSTRNAWSPDGQAQVRTVTAADPKGTIYAADANGLELQRGRWSRLEQEVVLNQPGEKDGILRVWVDGKLRLADTAMVFRKDERSLLRGVIADVHYSNGALTAMPSPKTTALQMTPFELYWQ
jgi:hypothetical protein